MKTKAQLHSCIDTSVNSLDRIVLLIIFYTDKNLNMKFQIE